LRVGPLLGAGAERTGSSGAPDAAQFVRPFVKTNKTDAADAEAIWEAAQRPAMRFVALKSEEQQAVLALHRMRAQLVKIRAMQAYQVRSLLYEFGVVAPKGFRALRAKFGPMLADPSGCPVPKWRVAVFYAQIFSPSTAIFTPTSSTTHHVPTGPLLRAIG